MPRTLRPKVRNDFFEVCQSCGTGIFTPRDLYWGESGEFHNRPLCESCWEGWGSEDAFGMEVDFDPDDDLGDLPE